MKMKKIYINKKLKEKLERGLRNFFWKPY